MELGVSVIICCYNSAARLPETLKHLAMQRVPEDINWEIIVIDNASTDNTHEAAINDWKKYQTSHTDFRVLNQSIPGKNNAFDLGIKEAKYEYLLTCDDDNWLNENYVATVFGIMSADTKIGVLGGLGIETAEQPALLDQQKLKQLTACGSQTWAETEHWVYGAGATFRKSIILSLIKKGWQLITPGRVGAKLNGGEDAEFCFIIYLSGYKIIADDRLIFKHFIPLKRQTLGYLFNLHYWLSYSNVLLNSYFTIINTEKQPIEKVLKGWLLAITKTVVKQRILLLLQTIRTGKKPSIEQKLSLKSNSGTFHALLTKSKDIAKHHYQIKALLRADEKHSPPKIDA